MQGERCGGCWRREGVGGGVYVYVVHCVCLKGKRFFGEREIVVCVEVSGVYGGLKSF